MKLETISTETGAKAQIHRIRGSRKWAVMAPGFGSSIEGSALVQTCIQRVQNDCNLLLIDHPYFGINAEMPDPENFTLDVCRDHTRECLNRILSQEEPTDMVLLGNSLGFWTFDQITREMGNNPIIHTFFGKSGIPSYQNLLNRLKAMCGGSIEDVLKFLQIQDNGWGKIQVNKTDPAIPIHRKFIDTIPFTRENEKPQTHRTEVVHATNDIWTPYDEMREHIAGEDNHIFSRDDGHGMTGAGVNINKVFAYRLFMSLGLQKKARPETQDELAAYYAGKDIY